ncbi:hypothetical protein CR156_08030 [Stenotrophomonas lactitubi]|nr:hypothetical protein CR156_08030 [Stenotrophomonas lactitubi]
MDLPDRGDLSEVGRCRIAGCQPHGCGCQAPRDGFTAPPQSDTAPPTQGQPAVAVAVATEVAGQRPALQQVQGCKPCRTTLYLRGR